jgi:SAM-dependent methyltransferase
MFHRLSLAQRGDAEATGAKTDIIQRMAWYKEWFGEEYLELYSNHDDGEADRHVDFVESLFAETAPRAILDLACGAGRHTAALRRRGYRALGVDLSKTLLAQASGLPRVAGDMRYLPFAAESFDWVFNFFTSFGYFESERENRRVLEEVARTLMPGGHLMIDLFNREQVLANLQPNETRSLRGRTVEIERWYDERNERINKRIRLVGGTAPVRTFLESVRAYAPGEVTEALAGAGLSVIARMGSFEGGTFEHDSPRLILVARKD